MFQQTVEKVLAVVLPIALGALVIWWVAKRTGHIELIKDALKKSKRERFKKTIGLEVPLVAFALALVGAALATFTKGTLQTLGSVFRLTFTVVAFVTAYMVGHASAPKDLEH